MVVKRPSEERKRLPPELEAFARSDEEKLRIRKPRQDKGKVNDPREGYTIPGVSNRDARAVYDQRVLAMQEQWQEGQAEEDALAALGAQLLDSHRLGLWRARRVMDFEAFVEEVVGVPTARARALLEAASVVQRESPAQLSERDIALWLRTEAGLHEGDAAPRVRIVTTSGKPRLELSVAMINVSEALSGAGVRHAPLARPIEERLAELNNAPRPSPSRAIDKARGKASAKSAAEIELEELLAETEAETDVDADAGERDDASAPDVEPTLAAGGERIAGGARLLTRKRPPDEPSDDDDGEDLPSAEEEDLEEVEAAPPKRSPEAGRERGAGRHPGAGATRGRSFERGAPRGARDERPQRASPRGEFERPRRAGRGGDFDRPPSRDRGHAGRGESHPRGRSGSESPRGQRSFSRDEAAPRRRHGGEERPAFAAKRGSFEKKGGFGGKGGGFEKKGGKGGGFEKKGGFGGKGGGFEKKAGFGGKGSFGEKRVFDRGAQGRAGQRREDDSNE